jgi:hypothetical protein
MIKSDGQQNALGHEVMRKMHGNLKRRDHVGRARHRWKDNILDSLNRIKDPEWIHQARTTESGEPEVQWRGTSSVRALQKWPRPV